MRGPMPPKIFRFSFLCFSSLGGGLGTAFSELESPSSLSEAPDRPFRFVLVPGRSMIRFDAHAPLHDFSGTSHQVSGEITAIPRRLQETAKAEVVLEAATLDTEIQLRNQRMRKLLETNRYPEIRFVLDFIDRIDESRVKEGRLAFTVHGKLNIRGVDQEIAVKVDVEYREGTLFVHGSFPLKMTNFGIDPPKILFVPMDDDILIVFNIVAEMEDPSVGKAFRGE